jgi:hypothetical protein
MLRFYTKAGFMPLVASLVGIVPAAPHIELLLIDKGCSGTVALLVGHFPVTVDIPDHMADRVECAVYLVLTVRVVDSTGWVGRTDTVDSTD